CCRVTVGCSCEHNCTLYGDCCTGYDEVCNIPRIDEITPARMTTQGAVLTLSGFLFGAESGSVTVGSNACTVRSWSDSEVSCDGPPGVGADLPVRLTTAQGKSATSSLSYEA